MNWIIENYEVAFSGVNFTGVDQNWNDWVCRMLKQKEYGDEICVNAIAMCFEVKVIIVFSGEQITDKAYSRVVAGEDFFEEIFLGCVLDIHFMSLVLIEETKDESLDITVARAEEKLFCFPINGLKSVDIFQSDVDRLEPKKFINDSLIFFYSRVLEIELPQFCLKNHLEFRENLVMLNSFLFGFLREPETKRPCVTHFLGLVLDNVLTFAFPVNLNSHWLLVVFSKSVFYVLDSMFSELNKMEIVETLNTFLNKNGKPGLVWSFQYPSAAQQTDSFSCGLFVLRYIELLYLSSADMTAMKWATSEPSNLRSIIRTVCRLKGIPDASIYQYWEGLARSQLSPAAAAAEPNAKMQKLDQKCDVCNKEKKTQVCPVCERAVCNICTSQGHSTKNWMCRRTDCK